MHAPVGRALRHAPIAFAIGRDLHVFLRPPEVVGAVTVAVSLTHIEVAGDADLIGRGTQTGDLLVKALR